MPFTISHAAAALPIQRLAGGRLRFAAIAIGCGSPDVVFLLHLNAASRFGHTLAGIFSICLPASWICLWLWDRHGRRGVQALLPQGWRLPPAPTDTSILWTAAAILLGAASHVTWDAFTHSTDWGVRLFPVLETPVSFASWSMPWFKVLQHASTVFGLAVLGFAAWQWSRTQPMVPAFELMKRMVIPAFVVGAAGVLNGLRFLDLGLRSFVVAAAVAGMFAMGVGVVLYGAVHQRREAIPRANSTRGSL
jgi:hypothetical protein